MAEAQVPNQQHETSSETTGIALPPVTREPVVFFGLGPEERAAVSALPQGSALLIAHSGPNQGARFLLDQDSTQAGRHPDAAVFLDDVTVSRKHALFIRDVEGFRLVDSGSLNGTYVNNDRVDSVRLTNGSEVRIGKFRLTFYNSLPNNPANTRE